MKIYQIKKGDTLSQIAETLRVPLSGILFVNPQIKNADKIVENQWLVIPEIFDMDKFKIDLDHMDYMFKLIDNFESSDWFKTY